MRKHSNANILSFTIYFQDYEIIQSPAHQVATLPSSGRMNGEDELPIDTEATVRHVRSADNSPLPFRRRSNRIARNMGRPHIRASTMPDENAQPSSDVLSEEHRMVECVDLTSEISDQKMPVHDELSTLRSEDGHNDSLALEGCGSSKSQGGGIPDIQDNNAYGSDSEDPQQEREDVKKDDLLEPCETSGDLNVNIPLSTGKQQDTMGTSREQIKEESLNTQDTEQIPQAIKEGSKSSTDRETRVLKQGYLRLHHTVQGRSKWPVMVRVSTH